MNIYYYDLRAYHFVILALLAAAGVCYLFGQYKFTLDVTKRSAFMQYKAIVVIQLVTIWFTRGFVWFTQLYAALRYFRDQGDSMFFVGGCFAGGLMSVFNLLMLFDSTSAAVKWLPK